MAANATTWTKETVPRPHNPGGKGQVRTKTKVKELLMLDDIDELKAFIKGPGVELLIRRMKACKGFKYVQAWNMVAEYILPKQQRLTIDDNRPNSGNDFNTVLNLLDVNDKARLLEMMRSRLLKEPDINNSTNADTISYELIPNNPGTIDPDRVGEEQQTHDK